MDPAYRLFGGNTHTAGLPLDSLVKNPPANAGDIRDTGLIPELGRSPGEGHRNPLQYSCLENPMNSGACRATVPRVIESDRTEVN